MNARITIACLLLAGGLGAAWIYAKRAPAAASVTPQAQAKDGAAPLAAKSPAENLETPSAATPLASTRTNPKEVNPAKEAPLEPVEPLLVLNLIVASVTPGSSPDEMNKQIDELLNGKHAGKTKTQMEIYFRSISAVLEVQKNPKQLAPDQVMSPEAINALGIEASWLKERVYN